VPVSGGSFEVDSVGSKFCAEQEPPVNLLLAGGIGKERSKKSIKFLFFYFFILFF